MFARSATPAAVAALMDSVAEGGPVRVVCPLAGDHALYVALFDPDEVTLRQRVSDLLTVQGLTGVTAYVVDADAEAVASYRKASFPTHAAVRAYVGFVLVEQTRTPYAPPLSDLVVGVAVLEGGALLVEATADDEDVVKGALRAVATAAPGAVTVATGAVADGAGFQVG